MLQWRVITLARQDGLSTLRRRSRFGLAAERMFRSRRNPALADPQLEALRRTAVLTWRCEHAVDAAERAAFLAAGFSADQLDLLVAATRTARAADGARS